MKMLLVGFDSAWTARKRGALAGAVRHTDGRFESLCPSTGAASFDEARSSIDKWRTDLSPDRTLILIDQPTIVKNPTGQRPVERLVSSPVGARRGGMQPAFTGRADMFGDEAPIWPFLEAFGGAADPFKPREVSVFETYPVLTLMAMGWLKDEHPNTRLPKYNPERRSTFAQTDWTFVCDKLASAFAERGLTDPALRTGELGALRPSKSDQDKLDALLCLLVAVCLAGNEKALVIGDLASGQIVVPYGATLEQELHRRCGECGMSPEQWVRRGLLDG